MKRWACVDIPALPLQLLVQREPTWRGKPAVVVDNDEPQGKVLWLNEAARKFSILPGMRFAAALSLTRDLCAGVVCSAEITRGVEQITSLLHDFSPEVEPAHGEPGTFWIDAGGLTRMFSCASEWGRAVFTALERAGWIARMAVGFTRYGSYAVAKAGPTPLTILATSEDESRLAQAVPLARLGLDPKLRDELFQLGVRTLGQFLELPPGALSERYEASVTALHRLAAGAAWQPLQPVAPPEPLETWIELESPDDDLTRLLFWIKQLLTPLLEQLEQRGQAVAALHLQLLLDPSGERIETVRAASPTRDAPLLLDLVRLRLAARGEHAGNNGRAPRVAALGLKIEPAMTAHTQALIAAVAPARDLAAANRALARVRAEFGPAAVACARLRDGHLPEASFLWEPLDTLTASHPYDSGSMLVRRVLPKPFGLPPRVHNLRDDGWMISHFEHGPIDKLEGPYVISGGWWAQPIHREYHFAQTQRGDLLWVYYDRPRRRWFLHGDVL
jgi:protein ImuB